VHELVARGKIVEKHDGATVLTKRLGDDEVAQAA
jgi:hypothetical protein